MTADCRGKILHEPAGSGGVFFSMARRGPASANEAFAFMIHIETVQPADWTAALELVLARVPAEERPAHVAHCVQLLTDGVLDPSAFWLARDQQGAIVGGQVCVFLPGATCLFWQPAGPDDVADALVRVGLAECRIRGVKIAQIFVTAEELPWAQSFLRVGFRLITRMHQLEHALVDLPPAFLAAPSALRYEIYQPCLHEDFARTLRLTYHDTLDCPELNGVRTIDEIIAGHQADGKFDPARWWLAFLDDEPVGVLMLTELTDCLTWDLSYLGIVPQYRRRGHGRALLGHALQAARSALVTRLLIAVDARNTPAMDLYRSAGFVALESYDVLLFLVGASGFAAKHKPQQPDA